MLNWEIVIKFTPKSVLVVLFLSPLIVFLGYGISVLPWDSEHAPAWVQAVGSVAAIGAMVWVAWYQQSVARLERQRQNYRYMFRAFSAAANAHAAYCEALGGLRDGSNIAYCRYMLEDALITMSDLSSRDMVDYGFGTTWALISRHVRLAKARIDDYQGEPELIARALDIDLALRTVESLMNDLQNQLLEHSKRVGQQVYQDQHL